MPILRTVFRKETSLSLGSMSVSDVKKSGWGTGVIGILFGLSKETDSAASSARRGCSRITGSATYKHVP